MSATIDVSICCDRCGAKAIATALIVHREVSDPAWPGHQQTVAVLEWPETTMVTTHRVGLPLDRARWIRRLGQDFCSVACMERK